MLIFTAGVLLSSCTNWLDLKPFDQTLDEELYSTERGTNMALNGLYISMADASLYGKNLSYYSIELLGQRYNFTYTGSTNTSVTYAELGSLPYFYYTEKNVKSHLDKIFSKAYNVIRDANYYIDQVEKSKVVSGDKKNILLGEGYAIRAFLHFDMLRFYGEPPLLGTKGIPYYTKATNDWQTRLDIGKVIELVLADIDAALKLLEKDPIITEGVILKSDEYDFFKPYRNRRLNYFAVKALKARVLFYSGEAKKVEEAGKIAKELIESEAFQKAFPWEDTSGLKEAEYSVFSHEVMFGIHVQSMYEDWSKWFNTSVKNNEEVLQTPVATLDYMFNNLILTKPAFVNTGDRRRTLWRESILSTDFNVYLSSKFSKPETSAPQHALYFQPLMRKSELYLIAAEVYGNEDYVDDIRLHRGESKLQDVYGGAQILQDEILREYMKDFVSEGQLFYYYKRRGEKTIWGRANASSGSSAQTTAGFQTITITDPKVSFTPPMPKNETDV